MILYIHDIGAPGADDLEANATNKVDLETVEAAIRKYSADDRLLLTADDGYASVIELLPLIEKKSVPLILFITTGFVDGRVYPYEAEFCDALAAGLVTNEDFRSIHRRLRGASLEKRERLMNEFSETGSYRRNALHQRCFLSWPTLLELNDHPLVNIGAHTDAHLNLARQPLPVIFRELRRSKQRLEEKIGCEVSHVSYPYGASNCIVRTAARLCGYRHGYGTESGKPGSRMNQRRICLKNML